VSEGMEAKVGFWAGCQRPSDQNRKVVWITPPQVESNPFWR